MKIPILIPFFLIIVTACTQVGEIPVDAECSSDSDCVLAGCSSQLCAPKEEAQGIMTTCEYKEEYGCLKLTSCGCINNKCRWAEIPDYLECLKEVK